MGIGMGMRMEIVNNKVGEYDKTMQVAGGVVNRDVRRDGYDTDKTGVKGCTRSGGVMMRRGRVGRQW